MREIVSALAAENSQQQNQQQERVLISLDIEDDKLFLLHFIIGTYFGPDLKHHHHPKQSAFQIQAVKNHHKSDELSSSLMKRAEMERVYHQILSNADPSLIAKNRLLRPYFNEERNDSNKDSPLFADLYPRKLHPESRIGNRYKLVKSIVFINDPDVSCMSEDCVARFKRLTGLDSFTLSLSVDVVAANVVEDEVDESLEPLEVPVICGENDVAVKPGVVSGDKDRPMLGLMDIGECSDAYLFRVSLPGVKRDERDFSCEVEDNGKVLVRGVSTTGEKEVQRYSHVFEMQTQNLSPPGHFSVSFRLPGPVYPQEFSGNFGTDGILEGIVMKRSQKQTV
ncbi:Increased DNA methylation 2 [Cardamine amara subsp. amara]|uniref:Increased DNA methylation 2 n=1 Tax=Cardamine amara subsp. amara TaxID=228776 RepID=A0ABD0Z0V6_CARAN